MRYGASKAAGKKETSVCKISCVHNVSYIYIIYFRYILNESSRCTLDI